MIDTSPSPLPSRRLEKLLRGLRKRLSTSAEKMSLEIATLARRLSEMESQQEQELALLGQTELRRREASLTAWDEHLQSRWDDAEMRSFKAVYDTAYREGLLRLETRKRMETLAADVKKRAAEIEQRFLKAKDVPIKGLNAFRAELRGWWDQMQAIQSTAAIVLAQRSLNIPAVVPLSPEFSRPQDSAAAQREFQAAVMVAQQASERIVNHPVAKFFESLAWLAVCAIIFIALTTVLILTGLTQPVVAVLASAVLAVSILLISFIGVRPWLKQYAKAEYPKLQHQLHLGRYLFEVGNQLAIVENDLELKRLAAERDEQYERLKCWRDQLVNGWTGQLEADLAELRATAESEKVLASQQLTQSVEQSNAQFTERLAHEQQEAEICKSSLQATLQAHRSSIKSQVAGLGQGGALRLQKATQKALQIITRSRRWCNETFPDWRQLGEQLDWPTSMSEPLLPIGWLAISALLPETQKKDVVETQLHAPLLFSPLQDGYLTITGDPNEPAIARLVRNITMRALTNLPPGKLQTCVIDPLGLGRDYGWLMHLSDYDPQLVSYRVWTQTSHIAHQLSLLAMGAEDFIQQSLRNRYRDIAQFNQDAGPLAEPFRLLVWAGFPAGLDDGSAANLRSLLDVGSRCGIIPILLIDPKLKWTSPEISEIVFRRGLHLVFDEQTQAFRVDSEDFSILTLDVPTAASDELAGRIVNEVGRRAQQASRVEVPLGNLLPSPQQIWQGDSSLALEIPIGQSGVGRVHSLKLGLGTAQHAIIAGKTGSGKSSLLHALITSAIMKYSPERLRLVLLDFKKGVEFQIYAEAGISHADIIGIESHREFGLSALEYIDACMQRRGELFRRAGVQDIASWNATHVNQPMPRMLLIIDEFQELFVDDDKLSGQASLLLDRIVRQGRSFGVHAVLSSQTLAGAYSLPRTTLGQMSVRIALLCDAADAQIIFNDDNPAATRLKVPGQAVYNDAGGRIEGNQPMQIGWLTKQEQLRRFEQISHGYCNADSSSNRLGRCVVYDGNRAASWSHEDANLALQRATSEINPEATWCLVGESVTISPAIVFPLTPQAGRNVLIVGSSDAAASAVLHAITASFVRSHAAQKPQLFTLQGAKPTDAQALRLPGLWQQLGCEVQVADHRNVGGFIKTVHELLKKRSESDANEGEHAPVLLNLIQLGRLRELRRDEDFSLDGFGQAGLTADKQFEEILRDGPNHRIYSVLWAEGYSTVSRWLSRSSLREIEIRLLMQMSGNDSTNLIDSVAASRLGEHVMLLFDEATGQEQKFRPFAVDYLADLIPWVVESVRAGP